ncbi:Uncharacterised protein [Aedoeadaptatus ivorii]|uniref:Uncharacterized protein n=1 Tax=Aedoeadaptatus ivorii TaxID=54006 RepID=A0A448V217_9FIRM|nr:hypothetical protein [Peptoniphilus ivorii]VEJ35876.1 Uncharacterised protein [Peptoniphilus ivorii]
MYRLGILIADITGAYMAARIRHLRPDINLTLLYDPAADSSSYREENVARFLSMGIERFVSFLPEENDWERDFYRYIRGKKTATPALGTAAEDVDIGILIHTIADGLFQRSYVLDIIRDYADRLGGEADRLVLGCPGLSYRADDFRRIFGARGIAIDDPLDAFMRTLPRTSTGGALRAFWTERNFPLERRMTEIFGEEIRFRTYYSHPWLRGEGGK